MILEQITLLIIFNMLKKGKLIFDEIIRIELVTEDVSGLLVEIVLPVHMGIVNTRARTSAVSV